MIGRLRRWIRSRVQEPEYDKTKDPIVQELTVIRRESLTAARASNAAMRHARTNAVEMAYLRGRREARND